MKLLCYAELSAEQRCVARQLIVLDPCAQVGTSLKENIIIVFILHQILMQKEMGWEVRACKIVC